MRCLILRFSLLSIIMGVQAHSAFAQNGCYDCVLGQLPSGGQAAMCEDGHAYGYQFCTTLIGPNGTACKYHLSCNPNTWPIVASPGFFVLYLYQLSSPSPGGALPAIVSAGTSEATRTAISAITGLPPGQILLKGGLFQHVTSGPVASETNALAIPGGGILFGGTWQPNSATLAVCSFSTGDSEVETSALSSVGANEQLLARMSLASTEYVVALRYVPVEPGWFSSSGRSFQAGVVDDVLLHIQGSGVPISATVAPTPCTVE